MSWESELFNLGNVIVTDQSLTIGDRKFSMETIRNAEVIYRSRTWMPVLSLLFTAISFEISGVSLDKPGLQMAAIAFLMATATLFFKGGPRYGIGLSTREGYIQALTSSDRFFVESVGQVVQTTLRRVNAQRASHEQNLWLSPAKGRGLRVTPGKAQVTASAGQGVDEPAFQAGIPARVYTMGSQMTGSQTTSRRAV